MFTDHLSNPIDISVTFQEYHDGGRMYVFHVHSRGPDQKLNTDDDTKFKERIDEPETEHMGRIMKLINDMEKTGSLPDKSLLVDYWGNRLIVDIKEGRAKTAINVTSIGPDGKRGTGDDIRRFTLFTKPEVAD